MRQQSNTCRTTELESAIIGLVRRTVSDKTERRIIPACILDIQIYTELNQYTRQEIRDALNRLVVEKKIKWYKTINNKAFML